MRYFNVEGLSEFLRDDFIEHYEYNKTFEEAAQDPFIIVNTSGSTDSPKPIISYHGGMASIDRQHLITSSDGVDAQTKVHEGHVRVFTGLPPFHVRSRPQISSSQIRGIVLINSQVAGLLQPLLVALYFGETTIWPPTGRPIGAKIIEDLLENVYLIEGHVKWAFYMIISTSA